MELRGDGVNVLQGERSECGSTMIAHGRSGRITELLVARLLAFRPLAGAFLPRLNTTKCIRFGRRRFQRPQSSSVPFPPPGFRRARGLHELAFGVGPVLTTGVPRKFPNVVLGTTGRALRGQRSPEARGRVRVSAEYSPTRKSL